MMDATLPADNYLISSDHYGRDRRYYDRDRAVYRTLSLASIMMSGTMLGMFLLGRIGVLQSSVTVRLPPKQEMGFTTEMEESSSALLENEECTLESMQSFETTIASTGNTVTNTVPCPMFLIDEKLLWCPNAKVGTSSIYFLLWEAGLFPYKDRCYDDCDKSASKLLHSTNSTKRAQVQKAPSFTVVRNPWDRLRATYVGKIVTGEIRPDGDMSTIMSFAEFVLYVSTSPNGNAHWKPFSSRCLTSPNEEGQVFHYDHVVKLEEGLFEGLERVFKAANVPFPTQPHEANHHTNHTDDALVQFYRDAATPQVSMEDLVEMIGLIYEDDIEAFGYSFPEYS